MSKEPDETFEGHSEFGFSFAARDAVEKYEEKYGPPGREEPVTLRVIEMTVTFENPIRDFSITLG
jgi:hypothetical protein